MLAREKAYSGADRLSASHEKRKGIKEKFDKRKLTKNLSNFEFLKKRIKTNL